MKKVKVCLIWMLLSLLRYLFYNKLKMCRKYVLALLKSALLSKKLSDLIQTINKSPLFFLISSLLWDSRMCVKFVLQSHFCHEIEKEKKGIVCVCVCGHLLFLLSSIETKLSSHLKVDHELHMPKLVSTKKTLSNNIYSITYILYISNYKPFPWVLGRCNMYKSIACA